MSLVDAVRQLSFVHHFRPCPRGEWQRSFVRVGDVATVTQEPGDKIKDEIIRVQFKIDVSQGLRNEVNNKLRERFSIVTVEDDGFTFRIFLADK